MLIKLLNEVPACTWAAFAGTLQDDQEIEKAMCLLLFEVTTDMEDMRYLGREEEDDDVAEYMDLEIVRAWASRKMGDLIIEADMEQEVKKAILFRPNKV